MWVLWFQSAHASSAVDTEHPAEPDLEVNVDMVCGSVSIRGSARKTVKVTGSVDDPDALHVTALPGRVGIEVDGGGRRGKNCSDLVVDVPKHASITAETVSAPVTVLDVAGRLRLETTSAPITVTADAAAIHATSISGPVTATGKIGGGVHVETVSAPIRVTGATGSIHTESVSGPVVITSPGVVSELSAETMSAPINVTGRIPARGDWSIESHTGPISVTLPTDASSVVTWATFRGNVAIGGRNEGQGQATLGAGGAQIDLETFTGPIAVSTAD